MSVIESNARTGFSNFGCTASLRSSTLRCRPFHLIAEPWQSFSPVTQDGGGNACGCPESGEGCRIMSAQLTPPQAM